MRKFLTIYDREGPRVGFAVARHEGRPGDVKVLLRCPRDVEKSDEHNNQ